MKFLLAIMKSGTLDSSTSTATPDDDDAMGHRPLEHPRVEQVDRVEDLRVL